MKTFFLSKGWTCNGIPVTLPHDAQITETRGPETSNGGHAYFPSGIYTYEKTFTAPTEWEGKTILAEFEGVYKNAAVSLNGKEICFHPYGYTGFFVELEGLTIGGENTFTVVADNSKLPNSCWYSGSGIYRPVWLHVCEKGGLRPESVKISTVSIAPAVIRVQSPVPVTAEVSGVTGQGTDFELTVPDAKLWSAEKPNLYTAKFQPVRVTQWRSPSASVRSPGPAGAFSSTAGRRFFAAAASTTTMVSWARPPTTRARTAGCVS